MCRTRGLLAALLFALGVSSAYAQNDTVTYVQTDGIGSVRMLTNENREVVARYDYFPFGELCPQSACGNPPSMATTRQFAGQERDTETDLSYFGARYYRSQAGRFTTVDPLGVNPLWFVNPQRMNRYAYALNNPFTYVDPDGRDAVVVNFSQGAPISGHRFGHNGIAAVRKDGTITFSDWGPAGAGGANVPGRVNTLALKTRLSFGANGVPTSASLLKLTQELEPLQGAPAGSVKLAYFKTGEAETAALEQWMVKQQQASDAKKLGNYQVFCNNCAHYALNGWLVAEGLKPDYTSLRVAVPNYDFLWYWLFANMTFQAPKPSVTTEINGFSVNGIPIP